jgi:hypothetical protein
MRAVDLPTNTFTMVVPLLIQRHGNGELAHRTPGSLCGRGWPRAVCKGFIYFGCPADKQIITKLNNYFSFYNPPNSIVIHTMY